MHDIVKFILYFIGFGIALFGLYFVDFHRFIRIDKKEYALLVYVVLAIALGFLIGHFFVTIGSLLESLANG